MHEVEGAHGKVDFASEKAAAPDDLKFVLDGQCASIDLVDVLYLMWHLSGQITRVSRTVGATTRGQPCSQR